MTIVSKQMMVLSWVGSLLLAASAPAQDPGQGNAEAPDQIAQARAKLETVRAQLEADAKAAAAQIRAEAWSKASSYVRVSRSTERSGLEFAEVSEAIRAQVGLPDGVGVVVIGVRPGSPAAKSGIKPNDLLIGLNDKTVADEALARSLLNNGSGMTVKVKLIRGGKEELLDFQDDQPNKTQIYVKGLRHASDKASTSAYWIGVPVSPVDATLRTHLSELPPGAGLIVNDVVKESPAAKAGLAKNDVLVTMGGKPLTSLEVLVTLVRESEGKPLPLDYLRAGKKATVTITPEKHEVASTEAGFEGDRTAVIRFAPHVSFDANGKNVLTFSPEVFKAIGGSVVKAPFDQIHTVTTSSVGTESSTKELEAAVKELSAKVEEIRQSVEAIRKATAEPKKSDEK